MLTCHGKFDFSELWHLKNNEECYNRRMEKGICEVCNTEVVMVFGKRFKDQSLKVERATKRKAKILYEKCKKELDYVFTGITKNGSKYKATFYYGVNKLVKVNGKKVLQQKAFNLNDKGTLIKEQYID